MSTVTAPIKGAFFIFEKSIPIPNLSIAFPYNKITVIFIFWPKNFIKV